MSKDLAMKTIKEMSSLLEEKKVSPVELVDVALENIRKGQEKLNPFITILEEDAKKEARKRECDLNSGKKKTALHGIPIALKDLFYTKGVRTTAGSKLYENYVPDFDGTVTKQLKEAGAIIIGKTNTHDLAFGPTTENSYFGPTRNPWNPSKISGGSSGGSAVAVATGMSYVGTGSDTGGSIRIPASCCGVVGMKPTYGLVSLFGVIPLSLTFDHPGPLTRSVMDAALTLEIMAGYDDKDPFSVKIDIPSYTESLENLNDNPLKGIKVGVPRNFFFEKVDEEVEVIVRKEIKVLEELGANVEELEIKGLDDVHRVTTTILFSEAAFIHKDNIKKTPKDISPDVRERLEMGSKISAVEYIDALKEKERIKQSWEKILDIIDVIVTPTLPITAYDIGLMEITVRGNKEPAREMCARHARLANLTSGPSLSIPCGFSQGLPVGMQIMGSNFDELTVFKVGYAYELQSPFKFPEL